MVESKAFEAENTLGAVLDRLQDGDEIVITRHGTPVGRLVREAFRDGTDQASAAAGRIRLRAAALGTPYSWDQAKLDRDEGRG